MSMEAPPGNGSLSPQPLRQSAPPLVRLAMLFYSVMAGAAWIWRSWWFDEPLFFATAAAAEVGVYWLTDLAVGSAAGLAVVVLSQQFTRRSRAGKALATALAEALGPLRGREILLLALLSGIGEELFFRGALQPRIGYVAASVAFGLVHFVPRRTFYPWTLFSIAAGFLLGGLFELTGNLLAPMATHIVVNTINLRALVRERWFTVEQSGLS